MSTSLSPGLLVSAPQLRDPSFHRTVILLVEHRPEGALGFVVNRAARLSFGAVLDELGIDRERAPDDVPVLIGGPVAPQTGWVLFDPSRDERFGSASVRVTPHLGVSASRDLLEAIADGSGPARSILVLGYAGWGAGQLDEEIRSGSWIAVDLDEALVYDTPLEDRWAATLGVLGIDPGRIVGTTIPEA